MATCIEFISASDFNGSPLIAVTVVDVYDEDFLPPLLLLPLLAAAVIVVMAPLIITGGVSDPPAVSSVGDLPLLQLLPPLMEDG